MRASYVVGDASEPVRWEAEANAAEAAEEKEATRVADSQGAPTADAHADDSEANSDGDDAVAAAGVAPLPPPAAAGAPAPSAAQVAAAETAIPLP